MRIKNVTIEGMHNVVRKTYDLSNLTYLHGPNGVGKSTVMQAIQLALLGYIPGTAKTKAELFRHANNHTMAVSLTIDDNGSEISVRRVWTGTSSSINSTVDIRPDGYDLTKIIEDLELPIFNFGEFMGMTANKLKDWFIEFLPSMEVKTEWPIILKEKLVVAGVAEIDENLIKESASEIASYKLSGVDEIRKANEYFKSMLSFKKKEAERIQYTIQSLVYYDDVDDTDTVEDVQDILTSKRSMQEDYKSYLRILERNADVQRRLDNIKDIDPDVESYEQDKQYVKIQKEIETLTESATEFASKINTASEDRDSVIGKIDEITSEVSTLNGRISAKRELIDGGDVCPFTKKSCDSVKSMLADYQSEIDSYMKDVEKLSVSREELMKSYNESAKKCNELIEERERLYKQINNLKTEAQGIKHNYESYAMLRSQMNPVPDIEPMDVSADIKSIEDKLVKLKANQKYSEAIDTFTADKFKIDNEIIAYKHWIDLTGVNGLQNMDGESNPFTGLEDSMNVYLKAVFGDSVTSKFNLVTKANSFSFGIDRKQQYIPFNLLSSGEKCLYTLALMLSLVKVSKSSLKIVMVDDLFDHLDNKNLDKLFKSLQKVKDIQMVFAGVKDIEGDYVVEV